MSFCDVGKMNQKKARGPHWVVTNSSASDQREAVLLDDVNHLVPVNHVVIARDEPLDAPPHEFVNQLVV